MEELLNYAKRIAYTMSKDPEMDSLAGIMLWRAVLTYDPTRSVPIKRWLARWVKRGVWDYWRRIKLRREEQKAEHFWEEVQEEGRESDDCEEPRELLIDEHDLTLLVQKHINNWPYDVVAKRNGVSTYRVRKMLREAEQKFRDAYRGTL